MTAIRVFVGVALDKAATEYCQQLQDQLTGVPGRLIANDDLHITLVPPFQAVDPDAVVAAMTTVCQNHPELPVQYSQIETKPEKSQSRLVWLACEPNTGLLALRNDLCEALSVPRERQFVPHVTLMRLRRPAKVTNLPRADVRSMQVQSVTLFQSPNRGGAGYQRLATVDLPGITSGSG